MVSDGTHVGLEGKILGEQDFIDSLEQLYRVTGAAVGSLDIASICADALDPLASLMGARRVLIAIADHPAVAPEAQARQWRLGFGSSFALNLAGIVESGALIEPLSYFSSPELPQGWASFSEELEGPLALALLCHQGKQIGAILIERASEPFAVFELKLLANAARQLAAAVANASLFADLQQSYRKLISAQEQLIRSESQGAVGGLAATLAHEIRNPLATIISSLSQLRKHAKLEGDPATLLEIAEEESLRLNRVVGALLEFGRPRMPRVQETRPDIAIAEVLRLEGKVESFPPDVEIVVRGEPSEMEALVDPDLFQRAVQHLVRNALAAVRPGVGRILIEWRRLIGQPDSIVVDVSDNGCGIPVEHQSQVFEPFFSTRPSGIGLGLSIVRRIVEDHGGSVDLSSKPKEGTKVRLVFPGCLTRAYDESEDIE
jgi:signal transduction histidine kinase